MSLGNFIPSMTPSQQRARDALFTFIMESPADNPDIDRMGVLYHNLADTLLRSTIPATKKIAGPTDWTLFFSVLYADGSFHPSPDGLAIVCAKWQFVFRSIRVHIARLQLEHTSDYFPLSKAAQVAENDVRHPIPATADLTEDFRMPMLINLDDPDDEMREANKLVWEGITRPDHDQEWEEEFEELAEIAPNDGNSVTPSNTPDSEQFVEPEDIHISENIDLQDVKEDADLLQ